MKKIIKPLLFLFLSLFIGYLIKKTLPFPIPDMIYGMVVLLFFMSVKLIDVKEMEELSIPLLTVFSLLFIPAGVGLMESYTLISGEVIKVFVLLFVSFFITAVSASVTVKFLKRLQNDR